MFLFTDTKFKQEQNTQNINTKQLKNTLFQWLVDEGFLSNQETATNGCKEGHNHRRDLTKGQLLSFTEVWTLGYKWGSEDRYFYCFSFFYLSTELLRNWPLVYTDQFIVIPQPGTARCAAVWAWKSAIFAVWYHTELSSQYWRCGMG